MRAFFDVFEQHISCDKLFADFGLTWEQTAASSRTVASSAAAAVGSGLGVGPTAIRAFNGAEWFEEKLRRKLEDSGASSGAKRKRSSEGQGGSAAIAAATQMPAGAGAGVKRSRSEIEKAAQAQGATGG